MHIDPEWFVVIGLVVSIAITITCMLVRRREDRGWSLSAAMSEVIGYDDMGEPRYSSSSSRLIALMGFTVIFWVYAGVGLEIIESHGRLPSNLRDIEWFMFFGLAMFAPYIANQARAALVSFGKGLPFGLASTDKDGATLQKGD